MKKPKKARKVRRIARLKLKIRAGKLKKAKHAARARKVKKAKKPAKQAKAARIKRAGKAKKTGKTAQIKRVQKQKKGFFSFLFGGSKRTQAEKHASAVKGKKPKIKKMKKAEKIKKTKSAKKSAAKAKDAKISKLKAKSEEKKRKIEERKKLIAAKKAMIAEERKKIAAEKEAMKKAKRERDEKEKEEKLEKEKQERAKQAKEEEEAKKAEIRKKVQKKPEKRMRVGEGIKQEYIRTDIPGFDALLKDGIPEGSAVLVEGGPGSGKTIFCLALAKNMCKQKKKVLYMSFEEPEYRLRTHLNNFGADVDQLQKQGLLYIKRFNALDIARSVEALLSEAKKELLIDVQPVLIPHDFEPDIVIIDSLTSIGSAFSGEESRFRIYMEQLFRYLESHQITSFLIRETSNPTHLGSSFVEKAEAVSFLSDGIIALYNVFMDSGKRKRAIEIIKMRGTSIDRKVVECEIIGNKGLIVYPNRTPQGKYKLT